MKVYCSGIGGIGLSAYAAHMNALGHQVYGSDRSDSALVQDLRGQGITITLTQDGSGVPDDLDVFVYSEAVPLAAPERQEALRRNVRQISYFAALGELTAGKFVISVCGTHGKSSTTAMLARTLIALGKDPNVVVGTKMQELNGRNWRRGSGDLWVVESCEYRRSFLYLQPSVILLTNADGDHFDAFSGKEDYENAFVEFVSKLPADAKIISHGSDAECVRIAKRAARKFIDADTEKMVDMKTPGIHMRKNAQLVLAYCRQSGLSVDEATKALEGFSGTWRRMQIRGETKDGVTVVDDYGHHPVEIKATLQAMREAYGSRRIVCVFQPHTHDRTLKLWNEFSAAFGDADIVLITDIYDARPDKDSAQASAADLAKAVGEGSKTECAFGGSLLATEKILNEKFLRPNDVLVVMGAGNITELAGKMLA